MWAALIMGLLALLTSVYGNVVVYTQSIPHSIMEKFRDMPASFGEELPPEGLRGFLVQGVPPDGCSALEKPPGVENSTDKWIVLIARYNCSFEVKIRNAQAAGYDCAIVHNVNSTYLETMSAKNPEDIDIPSVFVDSIAGQILSANYLYTSGARVVIQPPVKARSRAPSPDDTPDASEVVRGKQRGAPFVAATTSAAASTRI